MKRLHTIPVGDVDIHAAQSTCWCHPTETSPGLFVHNAKDCREAKERSVRDWPLKDMGIGYGSDVVRGWVNIAEVMQSPQVQLGQQVQPTRTYTETGGVFRELLKDAKRLPLDLT